MPICPKCEGGLYPLGQKKNGSYIYTCLECGWSVVEAPDGDVGALRDVHGRECRKFKPRENYYGRMYPSP